MINELREEQRYYEIPHLYSLLCENAKAENKNIITVAKKATNGKSQFLKSLETWKNIEI